MLVDDKLAKEKLDKVCFEFRLKQGIDGQNMLEELALLIRNTDLTDCQRGFRESLDLVGYLSPDGRLEFPSNAPLGAVGLGWKELFLVIAPAPDQGSVRNATDMRERCAEAVEKLVLIPRAENAHMDPEDELFLEFCAGAAKAIRALPVLEDD